MRICSFCVSITEQRPSTNTPFNPFIRQSHLSSPGKYTHLISPSGLLSSHPLTYHMQPGSAFCTDSLYLISAAISLPSLSSNSFFFYLPCTLSSNIHNSLFSILYSAFHVVLYRAVKSSLHLLLRLPLSQVPYQAAALLILPSTRFRVFPHFPSLIPPPPSVLSCLAHSLTSSAVGHSSAAGPPFVTSMIHVVQPGALCLHKYCKGGRRIHFSIPAL